MRKLHKALSALLAVLLAVAVCAVPAFAVRETGSVSIKLRDGVAGTDKAGVVFQYGKVADIVNGEYVLLDGYSGVDLNVLSTGAELKLAANTLQSSFAPEGEVATGSDGTAVIEDLPVGVYLLRVSDRAGYENVPPTLVAVPTPGEDGSMIYDVEVIPKHTPDPSFDSPQTGEGVLPLLLAAVFFLSGVGMAAVAGKRKKTGE